MTMHARHPGRLREDMMVEWITDLRVMHIAHHEAASFFSRCHLTVGITLVCVSALLGATASKLVDDDLLQRQITILLGLAATILAGLQTFVASDGRSKSHHASAAAFGAVRRDMEELIAFCRETDCEPRLKEVRRQWDLALKGAPNLPGFIHDRVRGRYDQNVSPAIKAGYGAASPS